MQGASLDEQTVTQKAAGKRLTHRYRWFTDAPLRDGRDAMLVNWVGVTVTDARGKVTYSSAFVTSLPITSDTVAEIVACARARWKVEPRGSRLDNAAVSTTTFIAVPIPGTPKALKKVTNGLTPAL